jgi:hypothetical protein
MLPPEDGLEIRPTLTDIAAERTMERLTRRSFMTGAAAALGGLSAWWWLTMARSEDGLPWPLRRALGFNQGLAESLFSTGRLAPTFSNASVQG